jgi:hypothetical protein
MIAIRRFSATCLVVLVTSLMAGCNSGALAPPDASDKHHAGDSHDQAGEHSHWGPHGGHLIELGANEEFHAEILHDDDTHRVTVYILDGNAQHAVPISQPQLVINMVNGGNPRQFKLASAPPSADVHATSSCFETQDPELCQALDDANAKGRVTVNINGKQFVGEIEGHSHDAHGHALRAGSVHR